QFLVAAAHLAAGADDAAGEGGDDAVYLPDGGDGGLGGGEGGLLALAQDQEVAAGHALDRAEEVLAKELAVHDRDAPVAAAVELLAELEGVAEEAQAAADAEGLLLDHRQAVVAGRGWARQHALADAVDHRFLQRLAVEREQEQADAGPAVGRLGRV